MGSSEEGKSEKSSSSAPPDHPTQANPNNIHGYPDWAAMQAYYGPRVALPQYYSLSLASGHAPHPYMWVPTQPIMPPYGAPYAAIYPHGNVYVHPEVSLGSNPQSHGATSSVPSITVTPLTVKISAKSSGNADHGSMKKLKRCDGLAISGNGSAEIAEGEAEHGLSLSVEPEGSSGSDGNTTGENPSKRKRSREGTPTTEKEGKTETFASPRAAGEVNVASDKVLGTPVVTTGMTRKLVEPVLSPGVPSETWLQSERELKRERRKQSNRECARRLRLRKQAETEELARKVQSLTGENVAIKSEIGRLTENSEKLKQENATLTEKLRNAQPRRREEIVLGRIQDKRYQLISTENLLARVNNSGSTDINMDEEGYKKVSKSGAKLHQLYDRSLRADTVAAG